MWHFAVISLDVGLGRGLIFTAAAFVFEHTRLPGSKYRQNSPLSAAKTSSKTCGT
jgi:hypothetical protein